MLVNLTKETFLKELKENKIYKSTKNFLAKRKSLFIGVSGSHAYGTANEKSDIDLRGCCYNSPDEILLGNDFEQFTSQSSDTTIYSFNKFLRLLSSCNPNVIELLGLKDEHYLFEDENFKQLRENYSMFLSKKAVNTFGGYASMQLRRLDNKSNRTVSHNEKEQHILRTLINVQNSFEDRYENMSDKKFNLYLKDVDEYSREIYMDIFFKNCPLREFNSMYSELNNAVKEYDKLGTRNSKAIEHGKLEKHMMHLFRLYYTCFDILEKGKIITFRENERLFLKEVREGKFLKDGSPIPEFFEILNDLESRLQYDAENTFLPDGPNMKEINEFKMYINENIIKNN
jgi:predicted nucleotidyltransferase